MTDIPAHPEPKHSALERLVAVINARGDGDAIRGVLSEFSDGSEHYPDEAVDAVRTGSASMEALFDIDDLDSAALRINEILSATSSRPRLSNHNGARWHLHVDREPLDWESWFLSASALAMAVCISDQGEIPWGRCARAECGRVFSGLGGGTAQTYCSNRCGSRERMAKRRASARSD